MFNPERESQQESRGPNAEHLAEGIRPIMACVGTYKEYGGELSKLHEIERLGHHSDYNGKSVLLNEKGFKADTSPTGNPNYVISPVDGKPKFTKGLFDCTSVVAVGRENETDKELSILTHQDPKEFLTDSERKFENDLRDRLKEFKEKCLEGTIDIVIAGGKLTASFRRIQDTENYEDTLDRISLIVEEMFGFQPIVICGPKDKNSDDIFLDTQNRRLYILRPEDSNLHNEVFRPNQISDMGKKWEEEGPKIPRYNPDID